jgi:hypothetical protein
LSWFNWTTNIAENPPLDSDYEESADQEVSVPLPTNKSKDSNATLALLNTTKSEESESSKKDDSDSLLGRKKGNFTTNQPFSQFNETVHIAYIDP